MNKKAGSVENKNYRLENNILTIRTERGDYEFKIDDESKLTNAPRIAELMVSQMKEAEKTFRNGNDRSKSYAKLLLSNLILSEKYIQLEHQYNCLAKENEKLKLLYRQRLETNKDRIQGLPRDKAFSKSAAQSSRQNDLPGENRDESGQVHARQPDSRSLPETKPQEETGKPPGSLPSSHLLSETKPIEKSSESPGPRPSSPSSLEAKPQLETSEPSGPKPSSPSLPETKPIEKSSESSGPRPSSPSLPEAKPQMETGEPSGSRPSSPSLPEAKPQMEVGKPSGSRPSSPSLPEAKPQEDVGDSSVPVPPIPPSLPETRPDRLEPVDEARTDSETSPDAEYRVPRRGPDAGESPATPPEDVIALPYSEDRSFYNEIEEEIAPPSLLKINNAEVPRTRFRSPEPADDAEFMLPSLYFLREGGSRIEIDHEAIRRDAELLEQKLSYFGVTGEVMEVSKGPVITTFEYRPDPGVKISKIANLADDLALALSAFSIRIVAPIPGKDVVGIEIPNEKKSLVPFLDVVQSDDFINSTSKLPICLGKDIIGKPVVVELDKMPHLLIAGATGTGKSVGLNAMITSILYKSTPDQVNFIMIDPKRIELSLFNDIPHLLTPVITDMKKANIALQWVVREMERRYEILARLQVRNIEQYNEKVELLNLSEREDDPFDPFSYIVIIIDELADLMMTAAKDIEFSLTRIAQMARAAGIHLVLATQRPSVDVLTGIIKANFPTRISFQVSSKTDSRTIIDSNGAETLLGRGDMLFVPPGTARLVRVHGTYLSEEELLTITDFLKAQRKPKYIYEITTEKKEEPYEEVYEDDYDEKYQEALELVLSTRQASISGVQRVLRIGYNRAARIIDLMEKNGIVGPSDGAKPRQVLVDRMNY